MKIIGHRGAAGLALENTLSSIELAKLIGVNAIEFDIRLTKDNQIVLLHDSDLKRVSLDSRNDKIRSLTLKQAQSITLIDERSKIPLLSDALKIVGKTPLIIEIKSKGCAQPLCELLDIFPEAKVKIASFNHSELIAVRDIKPQIKLLALDHTKPIDIIQTARNNNLDGFGLNFWLLNPLTYFMAKRAKLEMYVYTVNSKFIGRIIKFLYPKVAICSDFPERFVKQPFPVAKSLSKHR